MADSGSQATSSSPEILSGSAIPFRFEITWRSLTHSIKPTHDATPAPIEIARADPEAREWEMVLPRMTRPAALPGAIPPETERPLEVPRFMLPGESRLPRRLAVGVGAAALLLLGTVGYQSLARDNAGGGADGGQWTSERALDAAGSARGRWLYLFHPASPMPDLRFEFVGGIERRSLGWVFRAADPRNYYAAKLETGQPGMRLPALTRFAVIGGVEGPHIQRPLSFPLPGGKMWRIRMEAHGARFTISVENRVVEDWEDDRIKTGAVGFLNERDERGRVGSLRISFPEGGRS